MQRAYDLLSRSPGREGMWDSDDALLGAGDAIMNAAQYTGFTHSSPPLQPAYLQKEELVWDDIQERLLAEPLPQSPEQDISIFESLQDGGQFVHPSHISDINGMAVNRQLSVDSIASSGSASGSEFGSDISFDPPFCMDEFSVGYPLL